MTAHTHTFRRYPRSNGVLPLLLGWGWAKKMVGIHGGPFDTRPDNTFNVAVRAERIYPGDADVHLPIVDFSVPQDREKVVEALKATMRAALEGRDVYVGCMGGMGRTGLFFALLAKVAGMENPVGYVRLTYYKHAVETPEQAKYVDDFDVSGLQRWLMVEAWRQWLVRKFR